MLVTLQIEDCAMKIRHYFRPILAVLAFLLLLTDCGNSKYAEPPLHEAAMRGDLSAVQALLKSGVDIESRNSEGATALHWAAFKGKVEVATYLINRGADVNAATSKGSTPLSLAITHKKDPMIQLLKLRGAKE